MDTLAKSKELTKARFDRLNRIKGRKLVYCGTPLGKKVTAVFLLPLADFLAGNLDDKPPLAPGDLADIVGKLDPQTLALIALAPLLDSIARGWHGKDTRSPEMLLCKKIGLYLRDRLTLEGLLTSDDKADRIAAKVVRKERKRAWKYLHSDWNQEKIVAAGHWLMQCAMSLNYFTYDEDGFPIIAPDWQAEVDRIAEDMLWREPYHLPHTTKPPDWTGWTAKYDDRLQANFVRDWRPETKAAITAAFERGEFPHADGVNALQRVAFKIDLQMLDLVGRFADKVMDHKKQRNSDQRDADQRLIKADIRDANYLGDRPFYLTYNCDKRGRVLAIPHLNFQREDHVRSLFRFADGMPLAGSIEWLEIHCANSGGFDGVDKLPWEDRHKWVANNRSTIQKIVDNPADTFDLWKGADKPFAYVAACRELAAAWKDPTNFITNLPIGFDGTCNGVQHLALLIRDADAGKMVNLIDGVKPNDVYGEIIARVRKLLAADSVPWAKWWRDQLATLEPKQIRKLLKTPAMTFAYSVTEHGMADQVTEVYRDLFFGLEPRGVAARYLAKKIQEACEQLLPGPAKVMRYIRDIAEQCALDGRSMEWINPSGFPAGNRYHKPDKKPVYLVENGCDVRYRVADGCLPKVRKRKAKNASAPNFIHSLDGSHLVCTVNASVNEDITNIATIHDSFACLAPQALRFNQLIRIQLAMMYAACDPLRTLRNVNIGNSNNFPLPPAYGSLDPIKVQDAEYAWF